MLFNTVGMHPFDVLDHVLSTRGSAARRRESHWDAVDADATNLGEFAAVRWAWFRASGEDLVSALPGSHRAHHLLPSSADSSRLVADGAFGTGEAISIPSEESEWATGRPFQLFEERMKTSFVRNGVPTAFAYALAGAFNELASNAVEHARSPLPPIGMYDARPRRWSFSVTDVGVGIIGSLVANPQFSGVHDDVTALRAAMRDGVSATGRVGRGNGFRAVFRAFADRGCSIRFRSVGAVANWTGTSPAAHTLVLEPAPERAGFSVHLSGEI